MLNKCLSNDYATSLTKLVAGISAGSLESLPAPKHSLDTLRDFVFYIRAFQK